MYDKTCDKSVCLQVKLKVSALLCVVRYIPQHMRLWYNTYSSDTDAPWHPVSAVFRVPYKCTELITTPALHCMCDIVTTNNRATANQVHLRHRDN